MGNYETCQTDRQTDRLNGQWSGAAANELCGKKKGIWMEHGRYGMGGREALAFLG